MMAIASASTWSFENLKLGSSLCLAFSDESYGRIRDADPLKLSFEFTRWMSDMTAAALRSFPLVLCLLLSFANASALDIKNQGKHAPLPLTFERNDGQAASEYRFLSRH